MEKRCGHCGNAKALAYFNRCRGRPDGYQSNCKECQLEANRQWARGHPEVRRAALRRQYERELESGYRKSKKSSPEKRKAHAIVDYAVRKGRLTRPDACSQCGEKAKRIIAHHHDYSKPRDVTWLCSPCHGSVHAGRESAA